MPNAVMPLRRRVTMPRSDKYPYWAYPSRRAFKVEKRRALRDIRKAIYTLRQGCAYLPTGAGPVSEIDAIVERLQKELGVKKWGR